MSTPENQPTGSGPTPPATGRSESTELWTVDDPEKTVNIDPEKTMHIPRPAGTPPPQAPPFTPPAATYAAGYASTAAPAATPAPSPHRAPVTQPWAPQPGPTNPAPSYSQPDQSGYSPAPGGYQPPSGYPQTSPYPPGPGYAPEHPAGEPAAPFAQPTPDSPAKKRRRTPIIIGTAVVVAAAAAVGVTGFWKPGFLLTRQLDITTVQEGVQHILTDQTNGYGLTGINGLVCNNGQNPSAKKGATFTCDLTVNGAKHHVEATVVDDNGTYQVGKVT